MKVTIWFTFNLYENVSQGKLALNKNKVTTLNVKHELRINMSFFVLPLV
jgi:hypothetical protein